MPEIRADHRCLAYDDAPDARRTLRTERAAWLALERRLAEAVFELHETQGYSEDRCASVIEWGRQAGYGGAQTRRYRELGRALHAWPAIWTEVEDGYVSIDAAVIVARVLEDATSDADRETWTKAARDRRDLATLRRQVRAHVEQQRQGDLVTTVELEVTEETRQTFARARRVASKRVGRALSDGEALLYVSNDFLDRHDVLRKEGTRRLGPTSEIPGSRYIPAAVVREVRIRAGDRCEYPGCHHWQHLEFAHKSPHCRGSGREASDFLLLCSRHHLLYDAGMITLLRDDADALVFEVNGFEISTKRSRDPPPWLRAKGGGAAGICLPPVVRGLE